MTPIAAMKSILPAKSRRGPGQFPAIMVALTLTSPGMAAEIRWQHLHSKTGDLPIPGESQQQTACLVVDVDKDRVNDFVLGFRQKAPALVWYRRGTNGWTHYVIENEYLTIEAGGAVCDVDGDGDPDVVFGGDWQS